MEQSSFGIFGTYVTQSPTIDLALPSARTVKTELSQAHSTYARAAVAILRFPLLE